MAEKLEAHLGAGKHELPNHPEEEIRAWQKTVADRFYATPLAELAPDRANAEKNLSRNLTKIAEETEKIIKMSQ
jgi:hypothetical protein